MYKRVYLIFMMTSLPIIAHSQDKDTISMSQLLNEVHIKSINAGDKTPVSFTNIQEEELESSSSHLQSFFDSTYGSFTSDIVKGWDEELRNEK